MREEMPRRASSIICEKAKRKIPGKMNANCASGWYLKISRDTNKIVTIITEYTTYLNNAFMTGTC